MTVTLEVKCVGLTQSHEGHHTTTFVGEKDRSVDSFRQEVTVIHPEMRFNLDGIYTVSIEAKKA